MSGDFKDWIVYQKAFGLAMKIFRITACFPKDEQYSLVSQIRRSSRSVCANLAEAFRRKSSVKYFIHKLCDCDTENTETQVWLNFAESCNYIGAETFNELKELQMEVGKLIGAMLRNPGKFIHHKP
ncbi:MAG: four helix bundle protein [Chitinophagaceae bacterium]|nr:four helix bundle protein [Chitinophagaceae bacterium]MBL0334859.1 four helix bundle protein [Chitinophagaceae bacterium]